MQRLQYKIGDRFRRLLIVDDYNIKEGGWKCQCDCGNIRYVRGSDLKGGHIVSCGCYRKHGVPKRLPDNHAIKRNVFCDYQNKAKKKKIDFELSFEQFSSFMVKNCFYCGSPPKNKKRMRYKHDFLYNGIDRFDSRIGYTLENCRACCAKCNYSKTDLSFEEWKNQIKNTYNKLFTNH